jgi:CRISPR/Cas system-associated exonuclease Cas4 (RecB family)
MKIKGAKRDKQDVQPHQRRWTAQGTAIGGWLQREILLAERHYKKFTGEFPTFIMSKTPEGYPFFEDFVKKMQVVEHNGERFSLFGTCDGVLLYNTENNELLRVGLEIKSKQTTYTKTSGYSMRGPQKDHIKQVTCYSLMYGVDYYLVIYVNMSKKSWNMSPEEVQKYPDIRVFGIEVTPAMKKEVLDYFANIVKAVNDNNPPKLDLNKWTFNNFKTACALSLSKEEYEDVREQTKAMLKSSLPNWKKQKYLDAFEDIKEIRKKGGD